MKNVLIAAAIATGFVAAPVAAQSFTGPRIEARVGYDNFENSDVDGVTYGGGVGYDVALANSNWRLGAEAGIDANSADRRYGAYRVDAGRDIEVGARLGYVVNDRLLVYGRGAYTNQRFTAEGPRFHDSTNADGWRVGGGAEYALTPRTYVKAEYRHSDYEGPDGGRNQYLGGIGIRF